MENFFLFEELKNIKQILKALKVFGKFLLQNLLIENDIGHWEYEGLWKFICFHFFIY
jgi:hypothetical protein